MKGCILSLAGILLTCGFCAVCQTEAAEPLPFSTRHLSPVVQGFGLPIAEGPWLVPAGTFEGRLIAEGSNSFSESTSVREDLLLDGETYRATLVFRYGLTERLEIGADLVYIAHGDGVADGFIEDFHETFNLVGNSRQQVENNQLNYRYVRNGRTIFEVTDSTSGPGDLLLSGGYQLLRRQESILNGVTLRAGLKLPIGESESLRSSGGVDFSLRLAGGGDLAGDTLSWFGAAGGLLTGDGDLMPEQQRNLVMFGYWGFGWQPFSWLIFKMQLDAHSSFFRDSDFKPIDSWSAQLVGGFSFLLPAATTMDLALSENIFVETAPDVTLHLSVRKRF